MIHKLTVKIEKTGSISFTTSIGVSMVFDEINKAAQKDRR